ncbi:hypothetical protein [Branchiibius sp. NY16-3462-2]|uniref:hypothetical protein n=1 Tax=Branchiibius sp. NY16-3462-2 TaxID=1807500 RepID=UPI00079372A5|nr:hypothetical protein [Branchiibius sp. NY16-3462-2]KYH44124.1 hypothetical protein AZH51_05170 [Branchiibius sp. NY16-3462-2]
MFRPSHLSSTTARRSVYAGAGLTAAAIAATVAMAPSASADEYTWVLHHEGTITTHLKKLNTDIAFHTTEVSTTQLGTEPQPLTSQITPQPGRASVTTGAKLGNLKLAAIDVKVIPVGPAKGTLSGAKNQINLVQPLKLQITKVTALGLPVNLVSGSCTTSQTNLTLTGTLDKLPSGYLNVFGPVHLKGNLTIPKFSNCGLTTPLLNAVSAGPDNAVTIELQPTLG